MAEEIFVGIDVSKAWLDIAVHERSVEFRVDNNNIGIADLIQRLKSLKPTLIVIEPTGGFEILVVAEMIGVGLPIVVMNAKRLRDFARATGQLATKTDKLDAKVLAHFAEAIRPPVRALPSEEEVQLTALLTRRRQAVEMLTVDKESFGHCSFQNVR